MFSLVISLIASAIGWSRPSGPTRFGPIRSWNRAATFRSSPDHVGHDPGEDPEEAHQQPERPLDPRGSAQLDQLLLGPDDRPAQTVARFTVAVSPRRLVCAIARHSPGSNPAQDALGPGIGQADEQDHQEDDHLDQGERPQPRVADRPGIEEDRLDVEDHEHHGVDVILNPEPDPGLAVGPHAALVGVHLASDRFRGAMSRTTISGASAKPIAPRRSKTDEDVII